MRPPTPPPSHPAVKKKRLETKLIAGKWTSGWTRTRSKHNLQHLQHTVKGELRWLCGKSWVALKFQAFERFRREVSMLGIDAGMFQRQ